MSVLSSACASYVGSVSRLTAARPFVLTAPGGAIRCIGGRIEGGDGGATDTRRAFMSRPVAIDQSRTMATMASWISGAAAGGIGV
jgi:hypothetical protein